jgi:signal transduction histidine kinase/CheY-like chemotaxis protein
VQTIPEVRRTDGGTAATLPAARRRLRVPFWWDRASRPASPAAGIKPASGARCLSERDAGATGRPAVAPPLPTQPPRGQRTRTAAGLSLCVLAPLAVALAFLVVAFEGAAASLAAVAALAVAGVAVSILLARDAAARSAREQAERQQALLAELPVATYAARLADSRPEYVSPQIERLLELTAEQAFDVGDFWTPRLHELDRERVLRHWRAWCAEPAARPFRHTYRLLTESGRAVWVEDVTVLIGERGGTRSFQRHLLDVTGRHELAEQLREAQKHEALGRVASAVAHDFNNLLTVVGGYAELLRARLDEGAEREGAAAIDAAARRGTALVRQLLSFARPRPSDRRVVDLNAVVADFAPLVRQVIGEDIEFLLGLERHPLPVEVDSARLDQVLMNLVVNARDAMPDGGRLAIATSAVELDVLDEDGVGREWAALLSVSDSGTGLEAETADRVFEPFFSTKEHGQGSGLGLATSRGIVTEAGGSLDFSTVPGRGTTFWVQLPLASADYEAPEEPQSIVSAPLGGQEAILLVEDEPALRELEQAMLEDAGYEVHAAADAEDALELAGRHEVDLVVVDVVLPGRSGLQLVEELGARGSDFPAVFVSGYVSDEVLSRGLPTRAAAVIEKPFSRETLLRAIREALDGSGATVVPLPAAAVSSQLVRCLGCGAHYRRPLPHVSPATTVCPKCEYVGWAPLD